MQKFTEDHLGEPLTPADLARAAGYSMYHAARMFNAMTGRAPFLHVVQPGLDEQREEATADERIPSRVGLQPHQALDRPARVGVLGWKKVEP